MKIIEGLRKALMAILIIDFGVMVVIVIAQVFMRYIVGHALMWGDELLKTLLVWGVFLSIPLCIYYQRHMALDNLLLAMPLKVQKVMYTVIDAMIIAMAVFYIFAGIELTSKNVVQIMATLHISKAFSVVALPVSAVFWIVFTIADLYYIYTGKTRTPLNPPSEALVSEERNGGTGT